MKIKTTLSNLRNFLKKEIWRDEYTNQFYRNAVPILNHYLREKVFETHNETYEIKNERELYMRIIHNYTYPDGAPYNPEYWRRKMMMGEYKPHKFRNYSFWLGTEAKEIAGGNGIEVRFEDPGTIPEDYGRGSFSTGVDNYVHHHEKTRSVVKATMLLAWNDLMDDLKGIIAQGIRTG